jgi:hypothetical protein
LPLLLLTVLTALAAPRTAEDLSLVAEIDDGWQLCTTSETAALGTMLHGGTLLFGDEDDLDLGVLHTDPLACDPAVPAIRVLTWADAGLLKGTLGLYQLRDVAAEWGAELATNHAYVISHSERLGIVILGHDAAAAQHGVVDLLLDLDRVGASVTWDAKRVLNHPQTHTQGYWYGLNFRALTLSSAPCTSLSETSDTCEEVRTHLDRMVRNKATQWFNAAGSLGSLAAGAPPDRFSELRDWLADRHVGTVAAVKAGNADTTALFGGGRDLAEGLGIGAGALDGGLDPAAAVPMVRDGDRLVPVESAELSWIDLNDGLCNAAGCGLSAADLGWDLVEHGSREGTTTAACTPAGGSLSVDVSGLETGRWYALGFDRTDPGPTRMRAWWNPRVGSEHTANPSAHAGYYDPTEYPTYSSFVFRVPTDTVDPLLNLIAGAGACLSDLRIAPLAPALRNVRHGSIHLFQDGAPAAAAVDVISGCPDEGWTDVFTFGEHGPEWTCSDTLHLDTPTSGALSVVYVSETHGSSLEAFGHAKPFYPDIYNERWWDRSHAEGYHRQLDEAEEHTDGVQPLMISRFSEYQGMNRGLGDQGVLHDAGQHVLNLVCRVKRHTLGLPDRPFDASRPYEGGCAADTGGQPLMVYSDMLLEEHFGYGPRQEAAGSFTGGAPADALWGLPADTQVAAWWYDDMPEVLWTSADRFGAEAGLEVVGAAWTTPENIADWGAVAAGRDEVTALASTSWTPGDPAENEAREQLASCAWDPRWSMVNHQDLTAEHWSGVVAARPVESFTHFAMNLPRAASLLAPAATHDELGTWTADPTAEATRLRVAVRRHEVPDGTEAILRIAMVKESGTVLHEADVAVDDDWRFEEVVFPNEGGPVRWRLRNVGGAELRVDSASTYVSVPSIDFPAGRAGCPAP